MPSKSSTRTFDFALARKPRTGFLVHAACACFLVAIPVTGCRTQAPPSADALARFARARHAQAARAPAKRLVVTVVGASDVAPADALSKPDPYVRLECDAQRWETAVARGTRQPKWGDSFVMSMPACRFVQVTLLDRDVGSDDVLGTRSVRLPSLSPGEHERLDVALGGGRAGVVHLDIEAPPEE